MKQTLPSSTASSNRLRAGAACIHCHKRKSKCDAQHVGTPCSGCVQRGLDDCHLVPTARGKYIRKPKGREAQPNTPDISDTPCSPSFPSPSGPLPAWSQCRASQQAAYNLESGHVIDGTTLNPDSPLIKANTGPASTQSPRECSWVDLFETVIKSRVGEVEIDKACITYLGESFPITTVLADFRSGVYPQLHHPGPTLLVHSPTASSKGSHPPHLGNDELSFLEAKRVFDLPSESLLDTLLTTFTKQVYHLYPAVILQDFISQWKAQSLPWILAHAACFAGAAFCPLSALHVAGFTSRRDALDNFYAKAKLLFDFGYERDKIIILQSVTLLTFWPSSPNDVWTFYHWIGFGVTLAESLGIHRSLRHLNMAPKDRSLLKRLWWILVVRDAFGAALFGRPVRINSAYCDVEYVTGADFVPDFDDGSVHSHDRDLQALYFCQVSSLAVILRDITVYRFSAVSEEEYLLPRRTSQSKLMEWRSMIPNQLDWDAQSPSANLYVATLAILYDTNLIFLNLQKQPSNIRSSIAAGEALVLSQATQDAAERIIDLAGSLVLQQALRLMPHEIFTGLFMAEAISYKKISSPDSTVAKLGKAQVNSCQVIFSEVRDYWDPAAWVMRLFSGMLSKGKEQLTRFEQMDLSTMDDLTSFEFFNDLDTCLGDIDNILVGGT